MQITNEHELEMVIFMGREPSTQQTFVKLICLLSQCYFYEGKSFF